MKQSDRKTFDIFQDKKGKITVQKKWNRLDLTCSLFGFLLLIFIVYPIFIWKNPVLIAIFIPFFIALVPVYVVVTSRKSYRLKMDKKKAVSESFSCQNVICGRICE